MLDLIAPMLAQLSSIPNLDRAFALFSIKVVGGLAAFHSDSMRTIPTTGPDYCFSPLQRGN